jgi:hypothetical protein
MISPLILRGYIESLKVKLQITLVLLLTKVLRISIFSQLCIDLKPSIRILDDDNQAVGDPCKDYENGCSFNDDHGHCEAHLVGQTLAFQLVVGEAETLQEDDEELEQKRCVMSEGGFGGTVAQHHDEETDID